MKKVETHIKEKMAKDPEFKARYDLIQEKVKVVKKIIGYRNKHKLSQADLARDLGVTQQYISKIEEGEFSNLATVENLLYHIGYRLELKVVRLHRKQVGNVNQLTAA